MPSGPDTPERHRARLGAWVRLWGRTTPGDGDRSVNVAPTGGSRLVLHGLPHLDEPRAPSHGPSIGRGILPVTRGRAAFTRSQVDDWSRNRRTASTRANTPRPLTTNKVPARTIHMVPVPRPVKAREPAVVAVAEEVGGD